MPQNCCALLPFIMTWNWIKLANQVKLGGRAVAEVEVLGSTPSMSIFIFSSENASDLVVGQREVNLRIKVDSRKLVKTVSDADESLVRIPATRQSLEAEEKWSDGESFFRFLRQKSEKKFGAEIRSHEQDLAPVGKNPGRLWIRQPGPDPINKI